MAKSYTVIVGNLGTVFSTFSITAARNVFNDYVQQSKAGAGRVAWEDVTLMSGDDILDDYTALRDDEEAED